MSIIVDKINFMLKTIGIEDIAKETAINLNTINNVLSGVSTFSSDERIEYNKFYSRYTYDLLKTNGASSKVAHQFKGNSIVYVENVINTYNTILDWSVEGIMDRLKVTEPEQYYQYKDTLYGFYKSIVKKGLQDSYKRFDEIAIYPGLSIF